MKEIRIRRNKVKELYNQGKTQKEIAKELKIASNTIVRDIKYLKEQGEIDNNKIDTRRNKVKELYNQGKIQKEIAKELKVSSNTISKDIKYLKEQGKIEDKEIYNIKKIDTRRNKVKELYNQGKIQKEIAKELKVASNTIVRDIKYLKEQGKIDKRLSKIKLQMQEYILNCKNRFKENNMKLEELPQIRHVTLISKEYQDIVFYIRVCIRFGKIEEAMDFINIQISNNKLQEEEIKKMKSLREKIKEINAKYMKTNMMEEGAKKLDMDLGILKEESIELNEKSLQKSENKEKNDGEPIR